jgi:hypothetical protein
MRYQRSVGIRQARKIIWADKSATNYETGITSKRRSPWLCPAPSGGAGLFLSLYFASTYDDFLEPR